MARTAPYFAPAAILLCTIPAALLLLPILSSSALAGRGALMNAALNSSVAAHDDVAIDDFFIITQRKTMESGSIRLDMIRVDSLMDPLAKQSPERLRKAIERSIRRVLVLAKRAKGTMNAYPSSDEKASDDAVEASPAPVYSSTTGEYLVNLALGTPPQSFNGVLDTGSDLVWTQSKPCDECFKQSDPLFDPSKSSTYNTLPCDDSFCNALPIPLCEGSTCNYYYAYGDGSTTLGALSTDTLTIGGSTVDTFAFGAGFTNTGNIGEIGTDGIVGMGAGPLSLVSQMSSSIGSKFSYCLGDFESTKASPLLLGSSATLTGGGVQYTPFLSSSAQPTFYYLNLKGISFNGKLLEIPNGTFDLQPDGSGGVIIDSGTTVTILVSEAYSLIKDAYSSTIKLPKKDGSAVGLDLCYDNSDNATVDVPPLTFHFDGADVELPPKNIFFDLEGYFCLALIASPSDININIYGNAQQQNFQFVYDKGTSNQLSFKPTDCSSL